MEFTDPFDWPATMPELRTIDNLLRCGICCEFLNIAMILPKCSHNYCSQCIRRYMNYKSQCPACNCPTIEGDIRNNKVLDEIIKNFIQVRPHILKLCKAQVDRSYSTSEPVTPARSPKDGKRLPKSSERAASLTPGTALAVKEASKFFTSGTPKRQPDDAPVNRSNEENICPSDDGDVVIIGEVKTSPRTPSNPPASLGSPVASTSNEASTNQPSTRSDKSSCPVCGVPVALKHINSHLDSCLKRNSEVQKPARKERRRPLPKLVYNIMSDKELRKKLKEYNLSTQGIRKELIRRIQEFTVLYNAQCDSDDPIPVKDVIKYYERMEKIRKNPQTKESSKSFKLKLENCQNEEDISKSQQEYLQHHHKQFDHLVKLAREKMKNLKKMPSMANATSQDDETNRDPSISSTSSADSTGDTSKSDSAPETSSCDTSCQSVEPTEAKTQESHSAESMKIDSTSSDRERRQEAHHGSTEISVTDVGEMKPNGENQTVNSEGNSQPPKDLSTNVNDAKDDSEICNMDQDSPSLFDSTSFSEEDGSEDSKPASPCRNIDDAAPSVINHTKEETSPVFSRSSIENHQQPEPSALSRHGKLPQNKLRRKRKTALEQLEVDFSNLADDSSRRASKRNKKI